VITVRPAMAGDADLLLAWANEPSTRAAGFHPDPIDPATHRRWLAERLAAPGRSLFVGLDDGEPVGPVRIDIDEDGRAEVGNSVAEAARGRGIGRALLEAGITAAVAAADDRSTSDGSPPIRTLVAHIRPDNAASLALFGRAGFHAAGEGSVHGALCRVFERPVPRPAPRVVAIVQARLGSTRLPGKVLLPLGAYPVLGHVMRRVARAASVDRVVLATTTHPADDPLIDLADREGWSVVRGSVEDVLDRYMTAARAHDADLVVRITSDCPLIDPEVVDEVVAASLDEAWDFTANTIEPRTYPRGLDTEVISRTALARAWAEDEEPAWREHVTPYLYRHPDRFRCRAVRSPTDHSAQRWVVDTSADYDLLQRIVGALDRDDASWREVLAVVEAHPEWRDLNRAVEQKVVPPAAGQQ